MMASWISSHSHGYNIVVSNANDALLCKKDSKIKEAVNNSSLSVPDGISLVLLAKLKGYKLKKRVYGPDLMFEFLKLSEIKGYSHFFYGATEETLGLLIKNLKELFPGLKIAGTYSPPFKPLSKEEDAGVVNIINKANPDVLWIGLGCPKQQLWMYEHKDKLRIPVMVGVGAAFDFLAGTKLQAPRWIRDNGFEWLFRLVTEPKRLWRRYLVDCPLFVYYVLLDTISKFLTGIRVRN
ncbi:MAG: WecB/TagA/CpsF family glycosyltransferase [Candidatus Subteraquimicrobiales bacterium]|nr:WecB/TagA/CpsF family glycosyltransferase [Candidatus Subteraquimicrobiales bacterium]